MSKMSKTRFWFSLVGSTVLLVAILGGGYMAYRFGYSQGAIAEQAGEFEDLKPPAPFYGYKYPYPHFGFGSLCFSFLFLFLIFGLIKRLFFFPHWGWHRMPYRHKAWKHYRMHPWFFEDDEEENDDADSGSS